MRTVIVLFLVTPWAFTQMESRLFGGTIEGVVRSEDGTLLPNVAMFLRYTSPHEASERSEWYTKSDSKGTFRFNGLRQGSFALCAQSPAGRWLNPCEWDRPIPASIEGLQTTTNLDVMLKGGATVQFDFEDPQGLLTKYSKTPGAHLLVGVSTKNNLFRPFVNQQQAGARATYTAVLPVGTPLAISVSSDFFRLSDTSGVALDRTTRLPVNIPAESKTYSVRLVVSGTNTK